jgi:hypothetical protein
MVVRELPSLELDADRDVLAQQVRQLQDRLAFYEGFDLLIQDNVTQARELFRLAAQERESAANTAARAKQEADRREAALRAELEAIAVDLDSMSASLDALTRRVTQALGNRGTATVVAGPLITDVPVAVVVHGVPSAQMALSLQRYVGSLPQVSQVSAREFVGGMLRLDTWVRDPLHIDQFRDWEDSARIQVLTERPDVLELVLEQPSA